MNINVNNPSDFIIHFEFLSNLVCKLEKTIDKTENSALRKQINEQIFLLGTTTLFPETVQKSLKELQKK